MLPDLTHELLMQMGFHKAGPRIKILRLRDSIIRPKTGECTFKTRAVRQLSASGPSSFEVSLSPLILTFLCHFLRSRLPLWIVITDANDVRPDTSSFTYGGRTFQLICSNALDSLPQTAHHDALSPQYPSLFSNGTTSASATTIPTASSAAKPVLIHVNLEKKQKSSSGSSVSASNHAHPSPVPVVHASVLGLSESASASSLQAGSSSSSSSSNGVVAMSGVSGDSSPPSRPASASVLVPHQPSSATANVPASTASALENAAHGSMSADAIPSAQLTSHAPPSATPTISVSAPSSPDVSYRRSSSALGSTTAIAGSGSDLHLPSSPSASSAPASSYSAASSPYSSSYSFTGSEMSDAVGTEGMYMVNAETGEIHAGASPAPWQSQHPSPSASALALGSPLSSSTSSLPTTTTTTLAASMSPSTTTANGLVPSLNTNSVTGAIVRYFMNDEVAKHRLRVQGIVSARAFSSILRVHHKLTHDFAIFMFDVAENRLRVVKDSTLVDGSQVYYVLENARIDDLYRKVEKRVKKDLAASGKTSSWNSDNNPLRVDFVPDTELYLGEAGRIGLCMCPGRKKKKAAHEWDRDLDKDLLRMREHYKCDVVVSLVRRSEMMELRIPNLLEEIERLGMESIHFPIKDKWIPDSMAGLIRLVDTLVQRLKIGKTIVIHCNGGKGRSGTVAVACMVAMGKRVVQSIDVVRKARSGTIRNPVQIVYVKRFKSAFKSFIRKKQALLEARGSTPVQNMDWEALAEQVAQDAVLDDSSDSESEMSETPNTKRKEEREREKHLEKVRREEEKARKEEDRAQEKARREEEKAQEKARKEEEKAQEKARKEEDKAQEKARREEDKARKEEDKARKEEEKAAKKAERAVTPAPSSTEKERPLTSSDEGAPKKKTQRASAEIEPNNVNSSHNNSNNNSNNSNSNQHSANTHQVTGESSTTTSSILQTGNPSSSSSSESKPGSPDGKPRSNKQNKSSDGKNEKSERSQTEEKAEKPDKPEKQTKAKSSPAVDTGSNSLSPEAVPSPGELTPSPKRSATRRKSSKKPSTTASTAPEDDADTSD